MRKQCYVDMTLQRNWEQYTLDVNEGNVTRSGIKEACIWHDVKSFRVLYQVGEDIMHDLLKGIRLHTPTVGSLQLLVAVSFMFQLKYYLRWTNRYFENSILAS